MSLNPLSPPDRPLNSRSGDVFRALDDILPVDLICGITQDSFTHLQYFFYAATTISAIVWVFVPISGYLPITLLFISAILFGYPQSISSVEDQSPSIPEMISPTAERYATYNILCPSYLSKSPSFLTEASRAWRPRKGFVIQNIQEARPDVLAIQEITPVIFAELQQSLEHISLVGEYKGHGTEQQQLKPDGVAIFYNAHKFEFLQKGHILSDTTQRI